MLNSGITPSLALMFSVLLGFSGSTVSAQWLPVNQPEQDACNAITLCSSSFYTPASYIGQGLINDLASTPCANLFSSAGEFNSMWLKVYIQTSGFLVFKLIPNVSTDDYDFAVLDVTSTSCSNLLPSDVVRCNFNSNFPGTNPNGVIGVWYSGTQNFISGGATSGSFCAPIHATAGEVYLIMINNFGNYPPQTSNPFSGFMIDFTGSTASFFDGENPTFATVIESCSGSQEVKVQMSEYIQCSSIAANGSDFNISGGVGISAATGQNCTSNSTDKIILNFATPLAPGNYTLSAQIGTDANTLLDMCGGPLLLPESINFTVPPPFVVFEQIDTPGCSEVRIKLSRKVMCDSIESGGSDFAITGPSPAAIIAAYGTGCDTMNFTDTVVILLQAPIQTDGVYTITAKKGTDGNTLVDSCRKSQAIGDNIAMTINSYDGLLVSPSDSVLCGKGYIQLRVSNYAHPPLQKPGCGPTVSSGSGSVHAAYIGSKDSTTDINTPFYGTWQDARAQYLYRASELRGSGLKAGSILSLEWKVTEKNSTAQYKGFTIKIGCTQSNTLTGGFTSGAQVVYSTPGYSTTPGWNKFNLVTPYNWDGQSNLIVEVCYDNTISSVSDKVAHGIASANSVLRRYGNNLSGCGITTQGNAQSWSNIRPNIRFSISDPPTGPFSYAWTPKLSLSDSTAEEPILHFEGNTIFHVTTIDRFGCAHRDSTVYTLSIRDPQLVPKEETICMGDQIQLFASGGVTYNWLAVDPTTLSCLTCRDPMAQPYEASTYSVVISDQYKCSDTLEAKIFVDPRPDVKILPNDTIVAYGTKLQLEGSGAVSYSWSPTGVVDQPNIYNPIATITGPVAIILNGIYSTGCSSTDTLYVDVDYRDPIVIPSAFSPNNDGKNDLFRIGSLSFQRLQEFRVYNRWGQQVFSTQDPKAGWDGTVNGVVQDMGVYHYIIRLAYPDGKVEVYKGDITLVR